MTVSRANAARSVVTYWAVGRAEASSLVALQLNDGPPLLLSIMHARNIALALQEEANTVAQREAAGAKLA